MVICSASPLRCLLIVCGTQEYSRPKLIQSIFMKRNNHLFAVKCDYGKVEFQSFGYASFFFGLLPFDSHPILSYTEFV